MSTTASREAFLELVNSGKRDTLKVKVYNYIKTHKFCSIKGIELGAKIKYTTADARVSELLDMGVIKVYATYNNFSNYITVTDPLEQIRLSQARNKAKVIKALKVLVKNEDVFDNGVWEDGFIDTVKWKLSLLEE